MADVATPPAAEAAQDKQQVVRPEKPDDDKYKEDLAKAEKEHTAAQEKLVSSCCRSCDVPPVHFRIPCPLEPASQAHLVPWHLLTRTERMQSQA
jgi:hypothetical protein